MSAPTERYTSLKEFFPFYLAEHKNPTSRVLHFIGTGLIALWIVLAIDQRNMWWLLLIPMVGTASPGPGTTSSRRTGPPPSNTPCGASRVTLSYSGVH